MKHCADCGALVSRSTPAGDNRERWVCPDCGVVHYQNPNVVVGCVPRIDDRILLCKRSIEPRYGFWTLPAGFMELGETIQEGAARETLEEACADVRIGRLFAAVDVVRAGQLHLFFHAELLGSHAPGPESLETALYRPEDVPWPELAFLSVQFALEKFIEDDGADNGVHHTEINRSPRT